MTIKPSGLAILRNARKFTLTWKKPSQGTVKAYLLGYQELYENSKLEQKQAKGALAPSASATQASFSIDAADYYPNKSRYLIGVRFSINAWMNGLTKTAKQGLTPPVTINFTGEVVKTFAIYPPTKPSMSAELTSGVWNQTTFSWSYTVDATNHRPFTDIQYQSILIKDCTETDGSKLSWKSGNVGWRTGTTGATGSVTITEDTNLITDKSYTRWIRVRTRGMGGYSDWVYRKHVYAKPNQAVIQSASAKDVAAGIQLYAKWTATANASRPIDQTTFQYVSETPLSNLACPTGLTWNDALISKDTSGSDAASFTSNSISVGLDEVLYVRVNTQHDEQLITEGVPKRVRIGRLTSPDNLSVSYDQTTYQATISADNNSAVPDSFLAVVYTTDENQSGYICGIITDNNPITVQCPAYSGQIDFGVYAVQGSYTLKTRSDGVSRYVVTANMTSETVWDGGTIPSAPTLTADLTDTEGVARLSWNWTWTGATGAEISWADHADAWESTDEPSKYEIQSNHAAQWNVAGLDLGRIWYFRVRLFDDAETFGAYSDIVSLNLSSEPLAPTLELSQSVIPEDGTVTASWAYVSTDGTAQVFAEICEATEIGGVITYGSAIASTETAQHITLSAEEQGWTSGSIINLCVRTVSASGQKSEWSEMVPVTIADAITIAVTSTLTSETITIDETPETVIALTALPLTVTVTGAGEGGTTRVAVERRQAYYMDRPDETRAGGYEGETIALFSQTGEDSVDIERDDLIGTLDDGALYTLICTVEDGYGQTAEERTDFMVIWSHQAIVPSATVTVEDTHATITPIAPTGTLEGDTADIYRLSADRPELVYQGAEFGTTYVDPYPAIGDFGGYRVVFISADGDYITSNETPAWTDYSIDFRTPYSLIRFSGETIALLLNQNISASWSKDFKETAYLGGSVQGDWNHSVTRTGTVSSYAIKVEDADTIAAMRRLAVWTGICHVRTIDGSSYAADVQVSEDYNFDNLGVGFSLKITRVDPEELDGMTLAEWEVQA